MRGRTFRRIFCVVFLFFSPFFSLHSTQHISTGGWSDLGQLDVGSGRSGGTGLAQNAAHVVTLVSMAKFISSWLFGCATSSSVDIWSLLPRSGYIYKPDSAFEAAKMLANGDNPDSVDELTYFYNRLSNYEQECAPFCVDQSGGIRVRSVGEIVLNFYSLSKKYVCNMSWHDYQACLDSLDHLEQHIRDSLKFRRRKINPLEEKFDKKGYIDEAIENYRIDLKELIAAEKQYKEGLARQARLEQERLEQERLEQARLEQERVNRELEENFDKKQQWFTNQVEPEQARGIENFELQDRLEEQARLEIQNYRAMIEGCRNKRYRDGFSEKHKLADLGLKQAEICEHELEFGSRERFYVCSRRLKAIVKAMQNGGRTTRETRGSLGSVAANHVQHDIYKEANDLLDRSTYAKQAFFDIENIVAMSELVCESSYAAQEFGQINEYENSYRLLDFASGVYNVLQETGKFVFLSLKGVSKGCYRVVTFPFILLKNLITAPRETACGIFNGISSLASCLVRGVWESVMLSGDEFEQSKTAETIQAIGDCLSDMSYEEKVEEGAALITELYFPIAITKLKVVERSKKFTKYLCKVLKREKAVVAALEAEGAGPLLMKAGGPVVASVKEAALEGRLIEAIGRFNANDIHHILQKHHNWCRVVSDSGDWKQIAEIIRKVLKEGVEKPYRNHPGGKIFYKTLDLKGEVLEVVYRKYDNGVIKISNAWVKKKL